MMTEQNQAAIYLSTQHCGRPVYIHCLEMKARLSLLLQNEANYHLTMAANHFLSATAE